MSGVTHAKVVRDEAGMRLDRWFKSHFPGLAFGHLQKLLRKGHIRVDGKRAKSDTRLDTGQEVRIPPLGTETGDRPAGPKSDLPPADEAFIRSLVIHKDDAVIAINKPPGLAVQGGPGIDTHVDGLLDGLRYRADQRPRLVHRLDRETGGVLLIARTRAAAAALGKSLKKRSARKSYWALVHGVPRPAEGRISTYLKPQPGQYEGRMMRARHGDTDAQHAESLYRVVEQVGSKFSWVALSPVTGRKHQLRVHMSGLGHPIIGDPLYFDVQNWEQPGGIENRLHLHARAISIPHPDGGRLEVMADLGPRMANTWTLFDFDARRDDASVIELEERRR